MGFSKKPAETRISRQMSVRDAPGSAPVEGPGKEEQERERLSCDAAPRRTSVDPTESLRAELSFQVVPGWGRGQVYHPALVSH